MSNYILGIAFVWEYDEDFVSLIEEILHASNITTYRVTDYNVKEVTADVKSKKINFDFYLDRASDVDERFSELAKILTRRKIKIFNPYKKVQHAIDKASMHLEFITAGLHVPHSIIIPPHSQIEDIYLSVDELKILGRPFIIKPCNNTGGGIGVVTGAESLKEVLEERVVYSNDKYLLQEKIYPLFIDKKRAWFRCFFAFGKLIPVWWDDLTHIYQPFEFFDTKLYKKLLQITKKIAALTGLDFFSTEIVLTHNDRYVVIDYVNDQCDMRLKSKHFDGVPDEIVVAIIESLKDTILHSLKLK
jgi:glutathione synthase/RimK-type ligase-like ATP-grasp enzyme